MARLKVLKDGVELQSVDLSRAGKPELVLGRSPESDIKINDRAIGREHAVFLINANGVIVRKKSKFGRLAINGAEALEGALKPGDVISIADYMVRVEGDGVSGEDAGVALASTAEAVTSGGGLPSADAPDLAVLDASTGQIELAGPSGADEAPVAELAEFPGLSTDSKNAAAAEAPALESADMAADAGLEVPAFADSERTAIITGSQVVTKLVFKPGEANVEEFVIKKPETTIGRGSNCDIVIEDKKSSRKHLVLKKAGMSFVAQDQGSANGTYVNGVRITEQELAGDDVLCIGETEFTFKAVSQEYLANEQDYASVQEASSIADEGFAVAPDPLAFVEGAVVGGSGDAPPVGLDVVAPKKKETLVDKFKRQPPLRKAIILGAGAVVAMFLMNEPEKPKSKQPKASVEKVDASFNSLPQERKQFVVNTYQLAFELYKNKEYERSIYEVDKILQILPGGYKDAKDIKSFAQKSIDILKAQEEEKRHKEAEERLRREIADLVVKAEELVLAGKYDEAKIVFGQILERDPENPTVLRLKQQIEERDAKLRAEEEARKEREFKKRILEKQIQEARATLKAGRYYEVIDLLAEAPVIFAGDPKLLEQAKAIIAQARQMLREKADPHVAVGKKAMADGDFVVARAEFGKALAVDYKNAAAQSGIEKIRQILHARSKTIYTDAVIAESVSDFHAARAKYKECIDQSMPGDLYHGRCTRKFKRLELIQRGTTSLSDEASISTSGTLGADGKDPQKPQLPEPVGDEGGGQ